MQFSIIIEKKVIKFNKNEEKWKNQKQKIIIIVFLLLFQILYRNLKIVIIFVSLSRKEEIINFKLREKDYYKY